MNKRTTKLILKPIPPKDESRTQEQIRQCRGYRTNATYVLHHDSVRPQFRVDNHSRHVTEVRVVVSTVGHVDLGVGVGRTVEAITLAVLPAQGKVQTECQNCDAETEGTANSAALGVKGTVDTDQLLASF